MADTFLGPPGIDTLIRVDEAWTELAAHRRNLATGGVAATLAMALAATSVASLFVCITLALVGVAAGAAAVVDVHQRLIPNRLLSLSLLLLVVTAVLDSGASLGMVLVSAILASLPLWIVRYGHGLGIGDVKFAFVLGAAAGLVHPWAGLMTVWIASAVSGAFALMRHKQHLALGPWLWAGFVGGTAMGVLFVQVGLG